MGEGERSSKGSLVLVAVVVIIIIFLWLLIPNLSKINNPENEEDETIFHEEFEEFEGINVILYKNEELNVSLTREFSPRRNATSYVAEWINIWGRPISEREESPQDLYDEILREAQDMTVDQIRWYEFMIDEIIE
jgi:hypothetical protein